MRPTASYAAVILCVATLLLPHAARAQSARDPAALASGTRVRVTAPGALTPSRQIARVLAVRSDTIVLQPDGGTETVALPLAAVTEIEVSRGHHRSTLAGTLIGVLVGGVSGAAIGASIHQKPRSTGCPNGELICGPIDFGSRGDAELLGGLGAIVGGAVGALIGTAHQSERWETVSPPR